MTTSATTTDSNLLPVPGSERLRWVGEPVSLAPRPRTHHLPTVVATGGADAALVYLTSGDVLVSSTLEGAFASWPPTPGEPVTQMQRDLLGMPPRVAGWPGGRLVMTSHGGLSGRWDQGPGRPDARLVGWPTPDGAVYAQGKRDGVAVLEHRAGASLDEVTLVGPHPPSSRMTLGAVAGDGALWLACADQAPPRDLPMARTVEMFRGVPGELRACGSFSCPAGSHPHELLGRRDGGAWVVLEGKEVLVQGIDPEGHATGEPWRMPFPELYRAERAFASWGNGFVVALRLHPVVVLLSDGVHTTRVEAKPAVSQAMGRWPSIAVSPDGRSILVANTTIEGIEVARADVSAASDREALDPWEVDREALRKRAARMAERKANPPPPRLPGHPVGPGDETTQSWISRARFVSQIVLRATLKAITTGKYDPGSRFRGDHRSGDFFEANGGGDHIAFSWSPEGVVAVAFDHERNEEAGIDHELLNPERHFKRVPPELEPLVKRAIAVANREVTGAIWITDGTEGRWDQIGEGLDHLHGFAMRPDDVLFGERLSQTWLELLGPSEAQARVAIDLAAAAARGERCIVSAEQEAALLAGRDGVPPRPRDVATTAAMFAALGIDWPDAAEKAKALAEVDNDHGYALLEAVAAGDAGAVRALLDQGANIEKPSRPDQFGRRWSMGGATPLLLAIEARSVELTTMLLEAGANPSGIAHGTSPLSSAAQAGSRELCELLLKHGADIEPLRGSIFYAAVSGRSADVVSLFLDRDVERGMSPHWWDQFEAIAKSSSRPDLLARIPEPDHIKKYRASHLPNAQTAARKFALDARNYIRLRHILLAMRGIHEEIAGSSVFEGTPADGRHAWTGPDGAREVIAWNEHGMVGWGLRPGAVDGDGQGAAPAPAAPLFEKAPGALRELAEATAQWSTASPLATDALWAFPAATEPGGTGGRWGRTPGAFEPHGAYGSSAMDPRTPGWPREALELRPELATRAYSMSRLAERGEYPEITETDEAMMLLAPPGKEGAVVREEGVAAAVEMLGQIGIRWARL